MAWLLWKSLPWSWYRGEPAKRKERRQADKNG